MHTDKRPIYAGRMNSFTFATGEREMAAFKVLAKALSGCPQCRASRAAASVVASRRRY